MSTSWVMPPMAVSTSPAFASSMPLTTNEMTTVTSRIAIGTPNATGRHRKSGFVRSATTRATSTMISTSR